MLSDPSDQRHGTANGYMNYGCRCDRCRKAYSEYHKMRRHENLEHYNSLARVRSNRHHAKALKKMQQDQEDERHGSYYGYQIGCRCARCKKAYSEYKSSIRARKKSGK